MEFPPTKTYARTVAVHTRDEIRPRRIQWHYQRDAFQRDQAIARDDKRRKDGVHIKVLTYKLAQSLPAEEPPLRTPKDPLATEPSDANYGPQQVSGDTWKQRTRRDLACMDQELARPWDYQPTPQAIVTARKSRTDQATTKDKTPLAVDIRMISANGFQLDMRQPGVEVFSITLDGLDRMIEDKKRDREPKPDETDEYLRQKIPPALHSYLDFFSKKDSDTLAPHRAIDHKIELTEENTLGFCHLNKHSLEELSSMREYLASNLAKGFVISSKAPFASPVLFARKSDGSLQFCVDYRKLNALTKKNRYPLLLIDETLARLSKAKIFTKLDIRQAFHRIRMSPESEELM